MISLCRGTLAHSRWLWSAALRTAYDESVKTSPLYIYRPFSTHRTHRSKTLVVDSNWKGKVVLGGARAGEGGPTETLSVSFFGTSSSGFSPNRFFTAIGVKLFFHNTPSSFLLFDVGEGTTRRLFECGSAPSSVDYVIITHLHGDHILGLPSLIISSAERNKPLHIFGPEGIRFFVRSALLSARVRTPITIHTHELIVPSHSKKNHIKHSLPPYRTEVEDYDILPDENGVYKVLSTPGFVLSAKPVVHPVTCFGYILEESSKASFSEEKFQACGVPRGVIRRKLTDGQTVTTPDGRVVKPSQVISGVRPGRKITITIDTSDASSLTSLAERSSLLIHDATNLEECIDETLQSGHSTARMAGLFAHKINAEFLALTHISPRVWSSESRQEMVKQASSGFGKRGRCIIAEDFCRIDIEEKELVSCLSQETSTQSMQS
eukprot:jgi/Galph1/1816/GphlegSOOS_G476.1